jgi:hypothetical protein
MSAEHQVALLKEEISKLRLQLVKAKNDLEEKVSELREKDETINQLLQCREGATADEIRSRKLANLELEAKQKKVQILEALKQRVNDE